jgi:hypothetical protein
MIPVFIGERSELMCKHGQLHHETLIGVENHIELIVRLVDTETLILTLLAPDRLAIVPPT